MTAEDARAFEATSERNAQSVEEQLTADGRCHADCQAYAGIFTYRRWQAQGEQVAKGATAARAVTWVTRKNEDGEAVGRFPKIYRVFCRCQLVSADPRFATGDVLKTHPELAAVLAPPAHPFNEDQAQEAAHEDATALRLGL